MSNSVVNPFNRKMISPLSTLLPALIAVALFTAALQAEEISLNPDGGRVNPTENRVSSEERSISMKNSQESSNPLHRVLRSASELDYPPFAVVLPDGTADGFSVELLKAVTDSVGLKINITVGPWHELKERLKNRELDILPLVSYSQEREKIYDFSAPYLRMSSIAIFVRKGETSINGYDDLKHKSVLVMRGDTAHEYAVRTALSDSLIVTDTFEEAMRLLSKGEHDAVVIQQLVGLELIKKLGISNIVNVKASQESDLKPSARKIADFEQKFCFAVQEGDHVLLGLLNEGLAIVFANGTYDRIYNRWFAPILPQPPVPIILILKYMLLITVPLMLILAIVGIWLLKREVARKRLTLYQEMNLRKHADEQYRALFNKMLDGFALHEMICDEHGRPVDYRFLAVNSAFERITGLRSADITGRRVLEILPDTEPHWIDIYGKVALTGASITFENYSKHMGRHFAVTAYQPEYMQFASIFQDITESKLSAAKEEKLKRQLQQAQKLEAIGTLAGGISHDFNNILAPILGHTEILMEDIPSDSPLRISLDEIYKAALRARELVKQILTFSRQENSDVRVMKIQPVIKEALQLIRSTIPATIEIKQSITSDCGAVKADPTQIHQILMNLATNAFHAMEATGGELSVSLKEIELAAEDSLISFEMLPGRYACLQISDTGKGMSQDIMAKIFDPFFTTKKKDKGTGLGLSVVHGIVKSMNGAINVYSEPEIGTRFNIYIPLAQSAFKDEPLQTKSSIQRGTERILLVDDEESIVQLQKRTLERIGYKVISRVSSVEALEVFRANPDRFDLVITDMAMPKMAGDRLASELVRIRPDIPILLCTGFSHQISEEESHAMGIRGILMKPVIIKDLADKIREILDKRGQEGESNV